MTAKTDTLENGAAAQGTALAEQFILHVKDQAGSMIRYVKDLFDMSLDGRKAFRVTVEHYLKEQRAYVRSCEGQANHAIIQRTFASSQVRFSEAVTLSKAFDAGFNPVWELDSVGKHIAKVNDEFAGYHALVGFARTFLNTDASNGPTAKRGRKATPLLEKAVNYIAKLGLTDDEMLKLKELIGQAVEQGEEDDTH